MSEFQGIFFDFDGVLLDTEPVHWGCWAEVLRTKGLELTWEYYHSQCIGIDDRDMLRVMAVAADPPKDWDDLWSLYPRKRALFQERMTEAPFERELAEMLPALAERYRLAVVSSSAVGEIEPLLVRGGIREYFGTVVGGDQVKLQKPDPEPYRTAGERLGVSRALVLEDSSAGQASGRAAGYEVIAVGHPREVAGLLRGRLAW
jgi:beta-phosphoglucomutase